MVKPPFVRAASSRPAPQPSSVPAARPHSEARRACRLGATLLLALALALSTTTGCMVMDELDTAAAKMPTTGKDKKKDAKAGSSAKTMTPAERLAAARSAVNERSKQWWKEAKTMTPGEKPAGIVNCRLSDGIRFMSKDDCIVQGGRPTDGAG